VSLHNVCKLLAQPLPSEEDMLAAAQEEACLPCIEYKCFLPLMWYAGRLSKLPFNDEVKEMYFQTAVTHASHTPSASCKDVWRRCIAAYARQQQDVADYLWHVQEEAAKMAKQ